MKVISLAVVALLVVAQAQAGENLHRKNVPAPVCDNNGRCTTFRAGETSAKSPGHHGEFAKRTASVRHRAAAFDANGNMTGLVISMKTGAHARVGIAYAARFQAYIDDLESNHGARVLFMGGLRPGRCSPSSEHPCGKALDVCQRRRGVVDPRCNLPARSTLARIAASHGLFEGGLWCNSDYGHAQVGVTAAACAGRALRLVQQ
ncbi:MAG TPA: hypothetical protein VFP60_09630 [Pseudolabrys sp.]|nr:hypothetical protein [Pseudolabrys sp.]